MAPPRLKLKQQQQQQRHRTTTLDPVGPLPAEAPQAPPEAADSPPLKPRSLVPRSAEQTWGGTCLMIMDAVWSVSGRSA